jgi:CheY-like chemotaxis protein
MSAAPSPTILLVDDEEVVIDLLTRAFGRAKLPLVAVSTGREAMALLERQPFAALITDKNLPDVSGVEVLRAARRLQPFCACIMITGYTNTESVLEVLRLGAADYLEKPFPDIALLLKRVQTAMEHSRAELERSMLAEAVKEMRAALDRKGADAFREKTERQVMETMLELRMEEARAASERQVEALQADARAQRELERAVVQKLDDALEYLRGLQFGEEPVPAQVARGVARELAKRLEDAQGLLTDGAGSDAA